MMMAMATAMATAMANVAMTDAAVTVTTMMADTVMGCLVYQANKEEEQINVVCFVNSLTTILVWVETRNSCSVGFVW